MKTKEHWCLNCVNSLVDFDGDDDSFLVCLSCEGREGEETIVDDDFCCKNFKGE